MRHRSILASILLLLGCGDTISDPLTPAEAGADATAEGSTDSATLTESGADVLDASDAGDASAFKGWSSGYGNLGSSSPLAATLDSTGSVLVAVDLQPNDAVDLGGGGTAGRAVFGKLGPSGAFVFQKAYATVPSSSAYVFSVAADPQGASYVVGQFNGTVNFGGGASTAPSIQPFVVKYDTAGNHVFTKTLTTNQQAGAQAVATDPAGGFYVGYVGGGGIDFGGGVRLMTSSDMAIVRYDTSGNYVWDRVLPSGGNAGVSAMTVDSAGNPVFTGYLGGAVDFGGGTLPYAGGSADVFVAKLAKASGALVWAKTFGTVGDEYGTGIAHDPADDGIVIVGTFPNSIDFGKGSLTSAGGRDLFVVRFDSASPPATKWANRYGAADSDVARGVAIDGKGAVHVTGDVGSTVDFGGGGIGATGSVIHLWTTALGGYVGAKAYGGLSQGSAIAVGPADRVLLAGTFAGSMNLGFGLITAPSQRSSVFVAVVP